MGGWGREEVPTCMSIFSDLMTLVTLESAAPARTPPSALCKHQLSDPRGKAVSSRPRRYRPISQVWKARLPVRALPSDGAPPGPTEGLLLGRGLWSGTGDRAGIGVRSSRFGFPGKRL